MRLRNYQKVLSTILKDIQNLAIQVNGPRGLATNDVSIKGLNKFNECIKQLQKLNLFENSINQYVNSIFYNRFEDSLLVNSSETSILKNLKSQLTNDINNLVKLIDSIIEEEDSNTINIKIPETISNLSELKEFVNNLDLMFHVYKEFACDIKFEGVDSGSAWIAIIIGVRTFAKPCVEFLFDIADKALTLRNKKLDGDRKSLEIEELKSNLSKQQYDDVYKARILKNEEEYSELKVELAKAALKILNQTEQQIGNQNEILEKTKISLEKMGELLDKGMEIQPAFNATADILQLSSQFNEKLEEHKKHVIGLTKQKLIKSDNNADCKKEP